MLYYPINLKSQEQELFFQLFKEMLQCSFLPSLLLRTKPFDLKSCVILMYCTVGQPTDILNLLITTFAFCGVIFIAIKI